MMRSFEGSANPNGRAADNSFLLFVPVGAGPGTTQLHFTVTHEIVHSLGRYPERDQEAGHSYTEALANYVALTVPFAAGLYTAEEYLGLVRAESAGYYSNAKRSLPNSELPKTVWTGRNAWMLPYNRGSMYFADLDAKLKARHATVSVLSLANEMSRRIDAGEAAASSTWTEVLSQKVGDWALQDWKAMMNGELIYPAAGAFGDCLHSHKESVRIFDLGFASPVRLNADAVIGDLKPGSPADLAGLRNGDVLATGTDISGVANSLDAPGVLHVLRDGKPLTVTFDPTSGRQPGLAWTSSCVK